MKYLSFILLIGLVILQGVECKSFGDWIDDLAIGWKIGGAVAIVAIILLLIVLTCCCFGCACFAKSNLKANQKAQERPRIGNPQSQQQQQQRIPPHPQQQQQIQRSPSSLESQNRGQYSPQHQEMMSRQLSVQSELQSQPLSPPILDKHQSYQFPPSQSPDNYSQQRPQSYPASPQSQSYPTTPLQPLSPTGQGQTSYPPPNYPPPVLPQLFTSPTPTTMKEQGQGHEQQPYFGTEYPINFYDEQYQSTPMTSRVLSGFRYPEGLIEELRTEGNQKLKPAPPPKPIKLIKITEAPAADYGDEIEIAPPDYNDDNGTAYNGEQSDPAPDYLEEGAGKESSLGEGQPLPDY